MSHEIGARIARAMNCLRSETAFDGRLGPPRPLVERMAFCHTPGLGLAIVEGFEVAWAGGFGWREAGGDEPVTASTLFQAASISKPVLALAVMRLVQDGVLDLDRDVNDYLTSWQVPANDGWQPRLTLRQLLSHTAGVTVHGFPGYAAAEPTPSLAQVLEGDPQANTPRIEVNVLPGVTYRYSGGGTLIAQQVVIDRLGKPFPQLMRELVLEPLGMADSTFEQSLPADWALRAATGHPYKGNPLPGRYHVYPEMAAAGLWTTPADLARVGVELMRAVSGRPPALLSQETAQAMLQPQHAGPGEGYQPAIGFFLEGEEQGRYFYHSGWNEGFVAHAQFFPSSGQGVALMLNSNEGNDLMFDIGRAIRREFGWPGALPTAKTAVEVAGLERYAGEYVTGSGMELRVSVQDGALWLQAGDQPPLPIYANAELEFFARVVNTTLVFRQDEAGEIAGLTLEQEGQGFEATRCTSEENPCQSS
ncbi:MAG: serine hydrolase [Anaerolineae bacterium]|nr:serine hydrolase [Anaerolineae bacterium]